LSDPEADRVPLNAKFHISIVRAGLKASKALLDDLTVWKTQVRSPWIASALAIQNGGFGSAAMPGTARRTSRLKRCCRRADDRFGWQSESKQRAECVAGRRRKPTVVA
jgi:hypothetical protein